MRESGALLRAISPLEGQGTMDPCRAAPEGSNGSGGVCFAPFLDSIIYTLSLKPNLLYPDSDHSWLKFSPKSPPMAGELPPDTDSGGHRCSNGNKGVESQAFLPSKINTFSFQGIFPGADPRFPSLISGAIGRSVDIKCGRLPIPVVPCAPKEIRGLEFHPFFILI